MAVRVISTCKAEQKIPHRIDYRALGVSKSWFYKWRDREPTAREVHWQHLAEEIEKILQRSGAPTARRRCSSSWSGAAGQCR
ncbi:hypothetical protein [Streptomyces sp. NBC_00986]|uniref:hypothetical protein n=1 Tax=Streptomyces sp. NBC_00986 TaxID=2903702 RepID=UPI003863DDB2|nr:hypothetical protein OG504_08020 [Streptomyces sp. NBC_00986]